MPPWTLLASGLLLALGVYSPRWAQARLAGLLLLGALLTIVLMLGEHAQSAFVFFSGLSITYLKVMAGLILLHLALLYLEDGQRLGLLFILLAGVPAPQPGLIVALLAGAALRPERDDVMDRHPPTPQEQAQGQRSWAAALLVVAVLVGLSAGLPRHFAPPAPAPHARAPGQPTSSGPTPTITALRAHPAPPPTAAQPKGPNLPAPPLDLLSTTVLLGLLALGGQLLRLRPGAGRVRGRKLEPVDLLLPLALLLNVMVLDLLGLVSSGGHSALGSLSLRQGNIKLVDMTVAGHHFTLPTSTVNGAAWALWLLTLAVILLAFWRLRRRRAVALGVTEAVPVQNAAPHSQSSAPLHRVRLAYAQAEQALTQAGYPRWQAETPGQYAARIQQLFSALGEPFGLLTALYQPVRYGKAPATIQESAEEAAQQAENAAQAVVRLAAECSPPPTTTQAPTQETP